mmetsp:Transcript_9011/g.15682  ORF Transcript_9011/g.15682 Transcript_9011/m.15682 type:complete len:124 (+) Transcript_9011:59-430(+)
MQAIDSNEGYELDGMSLLHFLRQYSSFVTQNSFLPKAPQRIVYILHQSRTDRAQSPATGDCCMLMAGMFEQESGSISHPEDLFAFSFEYAFNQFPQKPSQSRHNNFLIRVGVPLLCLEWQCSY